MTGRAPNPYKPIDCISGGDEMCKALRKWSLAWEKWGNDVLSELDALKNPVGSPPQDATLPPKPPFKP